MQSVNSALLLCNLRVGGRSALLEFFDGITSSATLLSTQIDCSEMAFAKLALDRVLLTESVGIVDTRVSEDETSDIKDRKLVAVVQITSLVSTDDTIVDVCTVTRKILDNSDLIAILVFAKQ